MKKITKDKIIFVGSFWFTIFIILFLFGAVLGAMMYEVSFNDFLKGTLLAIIGASLFSIIPLGLVIGDKEFSFVYDKNPGVIV